MLFRRTVIDQIEVRPQEGVVQLRLAKQIVDGDKVIAQEWHRTSFPPDADVDAQMAAVNAHLAQMGEEPVTDWSTLTRYIELARA